MSYKYWSRQCPLDERCNPPPVLLQVHGLQCQVQLMVKTHHTCMCLFTRVRWCVIVSQAWLPAAFPDVLHLTLTLVTSLHGGYQRQEVVDIRVLFHCLACRSRMRLRLHALAIRSAMHFRALRVKAEISSAFF